MPVLTRRQKARSQLSLALSQYVGQLRTLDSIYLMFPETETVVTMLPGQKELSFSHHYAQQLYQMYYDVFESPIVWHLLPSAGGGSRMLSHIRPVSGPAPAGKVHPDLQSEGLRLADRSFRSGAVLRFCLDQQLCRTGAPLLWEHAFHVPEHWPRQPLFPRLLRKTASMGLTPTRRMAPTYLISYYNAVESGWKYLSCVPEDIVLSGSGGARAFSLLALLCGALGISLGSLILYRYVVRPISALMSHLSDMEQGITRPGSSPGPAG